MENHVLDSNFNRAEIFPIGYVYISTRNEDPSLMFAGTWTPIKDVFLLTAGDTYQGGQTGGEATHSLLETEMPPHTHTTSGSDGTHTHINELLSPREADKVGNVWSGNTVPARYNNNNVIYPGFVESSNHSTSPYYYDYGLKAPSSSWKFSRAKSGSENYHNHTLSTVGGSEGAVVPHNNMPPYRVVYAWERTS